MKCTEPVAPSSGFPTDRRRSGCRSENHQPRVLRARCMADTRGTRAVRQGGRSRAARKLRFFLFAQGRTAYRGGCSICEREEKRAERGGSTPKEFAEPGTLSSTFPTNLPLPRSAPRGASSYRRPVLGAGRTLREGARPIKGVRTRKSAQFASTAGGRAGTGRLRRPCRGLTRQTLASWERTRARADR